MNSVFEEPSSHTEKALALIWSEILEIPREKIGIYDNFVALGGNSLQIAQVMTRVNEIFSLDMTIGAFYETLEIASLSKIIESEN